jgi:hypothetical protein
MLVSRVNLEICTDDVPLTTRIRELPVNQPQPLPPITNDPATATTTINVVTGAVG